jgi:hypothetical protein
MDDRCEPRELYGACWDGFVLHLPRAMLSMYAPA